MAKEKNDVLIVGHKNPDTDSIAAAIAYANLKNATHSSNYIPARCGNVNSETQYVLDRFHMDSPKFVGDVRTQVRDMEIRKIPGVNEELSLKDAWTMMRDNQVVTLCITDENKTLRGIITTADIIESYMGAYDSSTLSTARTSYRNIVETLDAELLVGDINDIQTTGKIIIGAGTPDVLEEYIEPDDIVILGDRYESQLCAIEMKAGCLIICAGSKVTKTIQNLAREKKCKIMVTPHDTFTVARLIYQSIPIRHFMKSDNMLTFKLDDFIEDIQPIMASTRHRYFPVIDSANKYKGMVSRRNFLAVSKKKVILVDHNEKTQAVDGMETADILEIIDHHRLGTVATSRPVYFRNQPLGSTCTIIYQMYQEAGVEITPDIAGILLSAIISDTLLYRSPTCTSVDRKAGTDLAAIAGVDQEELAKEMFTAGSNLKDKTPDEIIHQDFKKFSVGKINVGIGQINSMSSHELAHIHEIVLPELEAAAKKDSLDIIMFMLTNILKEASEIIFYGQRAEIVVETGFNVTSKNHTSVYLPGVVSRKKQVLPTIINTLSR